jgi:hypothetical protein
METKVQKNPEKILENKLFVLCNFYKFPDNSRNLFL